jgi:hypothetical protein
MANKKSKNTDAFDVPVRLRATKGTGKDIEKVLSFLEERALSDGVAFDFKAELERYLVNRYLVLALSAEGADEATLNPYAHRAIGVFQGYIRAIQDAAGWIRSGRGYRRLVFLVQWLQLRLGWRGAVMELKVMMFKASKRRREAVRRRREEIDSVFGN